MMGVRLLGMMAMVTGPIVESRGQQEDRTASLMDSIQANRSNPGKAAVLEHHATELLRIATEASDTVHMIAAHTALGVAMAGQGDKAVAVRHHEQSLELARSARRHADEAVASANLGNLAFQADRPVEATQWMLGAVRAFVSDSDTVRAAACYSNLAFYLQALGDSARAFTYTRQAYELLEGRMADAQQLSVATNYFTGLVRVGMEAEATALGTRILERCGVVDAPREHCQVLTGLAVMDTKAGRVATAISRLELALRIAADNQDVSSWMRADIRMAEALERAGRPGEALKHLMRADSIARAWDDRLSLGRIAGSMHPLLARMGRYREAYAWMMHYHAAYDSLLGRERAVEVERLRETYEAERREQELEMLRARDNALGIALRRRNYLLWAAVSIAVLGAVAGLLWHERRLERHRRAVQESRLSLLRTQLDPHFIFNVLTTLQRAVLRGADTAALSRMFANFSSVIRAFLEFNREESIPLQREIEVLEKYIETQKLRFEEGFSHSIEVDPDIDANEVMVPPMLLQPFVENAVEHGIRDAGAQGAVHIRYAVRNGALRMTVQDNGSGRGASGAPTTGKRPLATQITRERIRLLNSMGRGGYRFDVREAEGAGTEVSFEIPLTLAA